MTMMFDLMCKQLKCPFYNEGEYTLDIAERGITYYSTIEWAVCNKTPEAECISFYPHDCIHLRSMVEFHVGRSIAKEQMEKEFEQDKMWKILAHE